MQKTLRSRIKAIIFALTKKGIPLHRNEDYNPFFIVGSGRCGTTLLRRILSANEDVYIPPENWALGRSIGSFKNHSWYDSWRTITEMTVAFHCYSTQGWFEKFPSNFVEEALQCEENKQSLSWLINQLYRYQAYENNVKCKRWGDKTPLNVNSMELILQVFPKAKFVHMLRDGVDVVNSYKNRDKNGVLGPAQRWVSAIQFVEKFKKKYPKKIIEIKYEDLVQEKEIEAKKVCSFLDITFDKNLLLVEKSNVTDDLKKHNHYRNALKPVTDNYIGRGRQDLTRDELDKIGNVMNSKLIELGYKSV